MQHEIANADFKVAHFAFFPMITFVTISTYTICWIALDPDKIAEVQVEINMYGYSSLFLRGGWKKLLFLNEEDDDDEAAANDDDDEWEYYYEYEDEQEDNNK